MRTMDSFTIWKVVLLMVIYVVTETIADKCPGYDHSCKGSQVCCQETCCIPQGDYESFSIKYNIWNMWYFWFIVIFILVSCFGGCGYWRRRQLLLAQRHSHNMIPVGLNEHTLPPPHHHSAMAVPIYPTYPPSYPSTLPTGGPPEGAFPQPPPYTEVVSKPDIYPAGKEDLPPYPGTPIMISSIYADDVNTNPSDLSPTVPSQRLPMTYSNTVPGLPPYSSANQTSSDSHNSQSRDT